ncbi:hypothetical protein KFE25_008436 [Diacronema lutheri]|uniref:WLM domain-containing protein n=2 Tax=Diacronema lutheri TaxID=2081491 RepID=A0A8J5X625_DIALT|nr:hypothetical protein KFE25_008436 [Diacronema lutheri]
MNLGSCASPVQTMMSAGGESGGLQLLYRGRNHGVARASALADLVDEARAVFGLAGHDIRLLHGGKRLTADSPLGALSGKVMVMATLPSATSDMNAARADPTVRGFDAEDRAEAQRRTQAVELLAHKSAAWQSGQDARYRFSRIEPISYQSFGVRPGSSTPHAFAARELLEKLAADPGVVACMRARELVVGTLGEMDPIDDRLMLAKRGEGGDLLGYNTNGGMRIDVKLRTDDLSGFMPYPRLAETLLHELCHNWVGPHNRLFWTLFAQMRVEYLHEHFRLAASGTLVGGQTTAALAGVRADCEAGPALIAAAVLRGIAQEVSPQMAHALEPAVREHLSVVQRESGGALAGRVLGGIARAVAAEGGGLSAAAGGDRDDAVSALDPRAAAAAAAEARARAAAAGERGKRGGA